MEYDERNITEQVMKELEKDIEFVCSRYWITGYDKEDLKQECRLRLWSQFHKYNFDKNVLIRTWANHVMKNHLGNILKSIETDKRKANKKILYISNRNINIKDQDGI